MPSVGNYDALVIILDRSIRRCWNALGIKWNIDKQGSRVLSETWPPSLLRLSRNAWSGASGIHEALGLHQSHMIVLAYLSSKGLPFPWRSSQFPIRMAASKIGVCGSERCCSSSLGKFYRLRISYLYRRCKILDFRHDRLAAIIDALRNVIHF